VAKILEKKAKKLTKKFREIMLNLKATKTQINEQMELATIKMSKTKFLCGQKCGAFLGNIITLISLPV
jgi:vacuolar-type H+-ATPase subunit D/Vma8